jgi:hypothetical protein
VAFSDCASCKRPVDHFPASFASMNWMTSSRDMSWFLSPRRSSWISWSARPRVTMSRRICSVQLRSTVQVGQVIANLQMLAWPHTGLVACYAVLLVQPLFSVRTASFLIAAITSSATMLGVAGYPSVVTLTNIDQEKIGAHNIPI